MASADLLRLAIVREGTPGVTPANPAFQLLRVTSESLARSRDFDDTCKAALRRAGSPGRYQPAQPMVHRACAMLHQAALQLRHALATGMISGSIIEGADFADFNQATNGAFNKESNATNVLAHALAKADRITERFGPAT